MPITSIVFSCVLAKSLTAFEKYVLLFSINNGQFSNF